ncbi:MAG: 2-hydroxyhepta-2,4-diene,7-dioate isomerase [Mycobacterium sp.]|jgi:2-keto-4-pentenoate hydratase/2-oxohepta-3-ene-1,7-dioic acid hydratase in catechol pathway|nr:2-hydroxyhepta-2,4-diene,7-dioate isomerase [Mycobacterium sp.]
MRLVSFGSRGNERPGVLVDDSVLPLSRVMADIGIAPTGTIRNVLPFLDRLGEGIAAAIERADEMIPLAQTRLGPPITDPPNLFDCGANYRSHLAELGATAVPTLPVMFQKPRSALAGPTDPIVRPLEVEQLDYEAELTIVIGKGGRRIPAEHAAEHIAGYMITNDVSSRDLGEGESTKFNAAALFQLMRAKGWDTFQPTGPWLVTLDEAGSYENIRIQTWVNDELRQDVYGKEMIQNPYQIIEWLSATTTLQPGDIITTGTPAGVAAGMKPPQWLKGGDAIRIEMTGLGQMRTPVLDEQDTRMAADRGIDV